ncbi:WD repeat and FYVE domain-containing protein 3 [Cichlidogyrus casuarinus]|uniref:WD repeat and FYVE domain-containing protein 3 n=1 Tax=Cichlidogyrus casuarinus TaxID=1844966 RepID=A0ABD2Q7N4_9PLAT
MKQMQGQWASLELELTRVRGLWGPMVDHLVTERNGQDRSLIKWELDTMEGPLRMRGKLKPIENCFYQAFPHPLNWDSLTQESHPAEASQSLTSISLANGHLLANSRQPWSVDSALYMLNHRPSRLGNRSDWGPISHLAHRLWTYLHADNEVAPSVEAEEEEGFKPVNPESEDFRLLLAFAPLTSTI